MDFTEYYEHHRIFKVYGGANGSKVGVNVNGKTYMIKFPPLAKNTSELSYTYSCISEDVACRILKILGLDVQNTLLAEITVNNKKKLCVACEDFESDGFRLFEFFKIKNSVVEFFINSVSTELNEILEAIEEQNFLPSKRVRDYFWDLFIADALVGNFDRHNGNWGFLLNQELNEAKLAPIFGCGSCLYPSLSEEKMEMFIQCEEERDHRIYVFPNSAIKINQKKINYFDFLNQCDDPECIEALKRIYHKTDLDKIKAEIDQTPFISEVRKTFYFMMVKERFEKLIVPAYQKHHSNK